MFVPASARVFSTLFLLSSTALLISCQSSNQASSQSSDPAGVQKTAALQSAEQQTSDASAATAEAASVTSETASPQPEDPEPAGTTQTAISNAPAQCSIQLAGGPPPVPPRGADFGEAVTKNVGKSVKRGVISTIGGALGGGLGSAIAGGVAQTTIRNEEDIKGIWMISDGTPNCACEISIDSFNKLQGKGADTGPSLTRGCSSQVTKQIANWNLGYAFAGYGAKFELKAADKSTVLASMVRNGIHYFNGNFADGTPVVMWRESQNYNQLPAFKKSIK